MNLEENDKTKIDEEIRNRLMREYQTEIEQRRKQREEEVIQINTAK